MEPSGLDDLLTFWEEHKQLMDKQKIRELAKSERQLELEMEKARNESNEHILEIQESNMSPELKSSVIRNFQEGLDDKLKRIKNSHEERISAIKESQETRRDYLERGYANAWDVILKVQPTPSTPSLLATSNHVTNPFSNNKPQVALSRTTDFHGLWRLTKPFTCEIGWENVKGENRLLLKYKLQKRGAPEPANIPDPKRLRVETSANALQRTITFDEVYQGGHALHKYMIVEWPKASKQWYILKCEAHDKPFTRSPMRGAAIHLGSKSHGYKVASPGNVIETFGYLVTGCDQRMVEMNNLGVKEYYLNRDKASIQQGDEKTEAKRRRRKKNRATQASSLITNPKAFHIYYALWQGDNRMYPCLILGWDDQSKAELVGQLSSTGLFDDKSNMPPCYMYDSNKIVGWASGYEDGGPKVNLRTFPIMFLDAEFNVDWVPARHLSKFPLYRKRAPAHDSGFFHLARNWLAKKEGFASWQAREAEQGAQHNAPGLNNGSAGTNRDDDSEISDASNNSELEGSREIADDEDYLESETDSSSDGETEDMAGDEDLSEGRGPWAYGLHKGQGANTWPSKGHTPEETEHKQVDRGRVSEERSELRDGNSMAQTSVASETNNPSRNENRELHHTDLVPETDRVAIQQLLRELKTPFRPRSPYQYKEFLKKMAKAKAQSAAPSLPHGPPTASSSLAERASSTRMFSPLTTPNSAASPSAASGSTTNVAPPAGLATEPRTLLPPAHSEAPSRLPDFEVSLYSDGRTSSGKRPEAGPRLPLYYSADGKTMHVSGGADIDPAEFASCAQEPSDGNTMVVMWRKRGSGSGSVVKLIFDRERGSAALEASKVQARRFVAWLQRENPEIGVVDPGGMRSE
ncbi:hypothetical protein F4775DRAFT_603488 [Biscogniauxia sp. FL1348]|nr:hypothetical protein F4775DRAFT_603488 [Biscogniauxia sp. FL1348]